MFPSENILVPMHVGPAQDVVLVVRLRLLWMCPKCIYTSWLSGFWLHYILVELGAKSEQTGLRWSVLIRRLETPVQLKTCCCCVVVLCVWF